jgi:eukaryotic-like serine/threonine-protein kinase
MHSGALIAGRYRLASHLGAGSMGQVWRARDERLEREVAIKVVDLASASGPVTADQFRREVLATAALNHPAIVTIFDGGVDGHVAFLVMELLAGESVAQRLARGPLGVAEAIRAASEVARALEATHGVGVVHRDIKPGNVMLLAGGGFKVLDFGIARLSGETDAGVQHVIGTAAYMSPEQAMGRLVGAPSDIYSLGCLIVAMLAGRPPFVGATAVDIAQQQAAAMPPRLRQLRPDAPAALDHLVSLMLAKDPAARPAAGPIARELATLAAGTPAGVPGPVPLDGTAELPSGTPPLSPGVAMLPPQGTAVLPSQGTAVLPIPRVDGPAPTGTPLVPAPRPAPVVWTPPPGPRSDSNWFRRGLKWIAVAMLALIAVGAAWAGVPRLLALIPGGAAPTASSTTPKVTPTKSTSSTKPMPTMPSIQLPTIALPSLPSAGAAALKVAVDGVTSALDAWSPNGMPDTKAKAQLQADWTKASPKILAGTNAKQTLTDYTAEVNSLHDKGRVPAGTFATLVVSLKAVQLLL